MNDMAVSTDKQVTLPSDQDSSGRTLGAEEIDALRKVIASGTLTSTKGTAVKALEAQFAEMIGARYAIACASGSAAIHCAIAAVDPEPGDEIITTSITDMGALTPIVYQGAVPVFCDVQRETGNVTAETIEKCISDRTKAIIVTHLFGNPVEMCPVMELAKKHGIPVIEDSAQAFLAKCGEKYVGNIGDIGCFSFQQGKHMTTGEGGIVTTNDPELARRVTLFVNKAWGYGDPKPDHYFLALNYRLTELQGAVALAQLDKLRTGVENRQAMADRLTARIADLPGIETPSKATCSSHAYWRYCVWVDDKIVEGGSPALGAALKERGIFTAPRYIHKPAFACEVFRDQRTFGDSRWPFTLARPEALDYAEGRFPGTYSCLHDILVMPWNEKYTEEHVVYIADVMRAAHARLSR